MKKLALIGLSGSGKSLAAREFAATFGGKAFDTDIEFERRYGSIFDYFKRFGEDAFRNAESELVAQAAQSDCAVIACGGGVVTRKRNMNILRKYCDIAFLNVPTDLAAARINDSDRPLKGEIYRLAAERLPLYGRYADYTIDASCGAVAHKLKAAMANGRKSRYDVILSDADNTLLDFDRAMAFAVIGAARAVGIKSDDDAIIRQYKSIVKIVWEKLERREITRQTLDSIRFEMLANALGESFDTKKMSFEYVERIKKTRYLLGGAIEFSDEVRTRNVKLYIITNSFAAIAKERLKALDGHNDGAFISELIGYDKPDVRYFASVHRAIGAPEKSRILVFGDSESSDIAGGSAFGADTCYFSPSGKDSALADYSVQSYAQLLDIL